MLSERRPVLGGNEGSLGDDFEKEISMLLREQRRQDSDDLEKELNLYRSGSAPPTVEGSLSAVGGLLNRGGGGSRGGGGGAGGFPGLANGNGFVSEEELRSDPAYLSYYYSNVNLNPRLPPPLLSKEDWRSAQRVQGGSSIVGGIGDRRKVDRNSSIGGGRSMRSGDNEASSEKINGSPEWGGDGLIGLPGISLGGKQKSFADIFQEDMGRPAPGFGIPSRSASRNGFENTESFGSAEAELGLMHNEVSADGIPSNVNDQSSSSVQSSGVPVSYSYAAALGASLSRSTTPDPQHIARAPSPGLAPIGGERVNMSERRSAKSPNPFNSVSVPMAESVDLVTALSGMKLSNGVADSGSHVQSPFMKRSESGNLRMASTEQSAKVIYSDSSRSNGAGADLSNSFLSDMHANMQKSKSYLNGSPTSNQSSRGTSRSHHQQMGSPNSSFLNYGVGGFSSNTGLPSMMAGQLDTNMPPLYENIAAASAMGLPGMDSRMLGAGFPMGSNLSPASIESQNLNRFRNHMAGSGLQTPLVDPLYLQYLTTAEYAALQAAALNDLSMDRNFSGNSQMDLLQKAYMGSLLSPQKAQYSGPFGTKSGGSNHHGYYGTPSYGVGLSYPGSPLASSMIPNSPGGPGSPMAYGDLNMHFSSGMRNLSGGVMGPWHLQAGRNMEDRFASSLLEEFKSNKTKYFELAEIAGHVVEFSADQYGSRFIQQKLETATLEEKNMVFEEIIPQALTLMTDVFGNYVIQKFFEHGIASQIRELASKLTGHVLTLSLQMYGCRVIQKAIEVVDLDQKIGMVEELDGHVIRCVRDQNGNHVIQKCIECVPEENIQFIVSTFSDQVVSLSTHPYGCRVVQRILEHCKDPKTQSKVMYEILGSVSMLAQDQYGNYVIQHVLEHGKPHERSAIIEELAGRIVQMSQQKFASNVVEKCLTFCGPTERQILVNEMLGTTDENEPLQAMMKDQFANYVVQKVLETCNDQQRELILSRIKVHLNALKKYTYGKHIVARVEKLVLAGERRSAVQNSQLAYMA